MSLVDVLLNLASEVRIRLWLRLRYPEWFIVSEIAAGLPLFSRPRVQQIIQGEFEASRVNRRRRVTGNPGPDPYEYQVPPNLFNDLSEPIISKLKLIINEGVA